MPKSNSPEAITPAVHLEFIQNQAELSEESSLTQVEDYHRAIFLHHHAAELEKWRQQARIHTENLAHLDGQLARSRTKLAALERSVPVNSDGHVDVQPTLPWNLWDRSMFIAALLGIVGLLVFGVLNVSFNLLESGLVTFRETPMRAYFWAALLPVGALCVKAGWDMLHKSRLKTVYLWTCLAAGIAGLLVWVGAYAAIYPTLSKTTAEQIASLSVFEDSKQDSLGMNASGTKWVDAITVAAQSVAEIFLSAVLGIYMTLIYARHRPVRLALNPQYTRLDEERSTLEGSVAKERLALAEAQGNFARLENQLAALLAYARSLYYKEAALRRDKTQQKQILLDQITEQLRSQLATVEGGMGNGRTHTLPHGFTPNNSPK